MHKNFIKRKLRNKTRKVRKSRKVRKVRKSRKVKGGARIVVNAG